jgi:hypothetical protein
VCINLDKHVLIFLVREYDIPAGTAVDISQNRDLDVWGPDGDKF